MPNVEVGENVIIRKAIVGNETVIADHAVIGEEPPSTGLTVIGEKVEIAPYRRIRGIYDGEVS